MMRNPFMMDPPPMSGEGASTFWATVVGTAPLRVCRDGEDPLPVTPKSLEPVTVGDRVLCLWERRQVIVLGKMGGVVPPAPAYPAPNTIRIDGSDYLLSGSVVVPAHTWSGTTPVFYTTVDVPIPYAPPFPYTFAWSVQESSVFSFAQNGARFPTGSTQAVRLLQIANAETDRIKRLQWQLVNA